MAIFSFDIDENKIELESPEILLTREFKALREIERNKCKDDPSGELLLRMYKEFAYIYLALDWGSHYADYNAVDKHRESLLDSELTEEEFNDPVFKNARLKFIEIQESKQVIRLVRSAQLVVDKLITYFTHIDLDERQQSGVPVFKVKTVIEEMLKVDEAAETLIALEKRLKQGGNNDDSVSARFERGYEDVNVINLAKDDDDDDDF